MTIRITALPSSTPLTAVQLWVDAQGGAPLRCCLRDSVAGEELLLGRVVPPGPQGAYAEAGPVFVHAGPCAGPSSEDYPEDFRARRQVFRAYDGDGRIVGGEVVEPGHGQEAVAQRLLSMPDVAFLHSRNVIHGCYMFAMSTTGPADPPLD